MIGQAVDTDRHKLRFASSFMTAHVKLYASSFNPLNLCNASKAVFQVTDSLDASWESLSVA